MGDFNTPFTAMDRSSRQKINKETQVLNEALDQMDFIDIYRTFHPNTGSPQSIRQLLTTLKGEIDNNTIIVGDFNTTLTAMDRSTGQKIHKET